MCVCFTMYAMCDCACVHMCVCVCVQGKSISVVFCGDFNSSPKHGIVQLMTTKQVSQDHVDWSDGKIQRYKRNVLSALCIINSNVVHLE